MNLYYLFIVFIFTISIYPFLTIDCENTSYNYNTHANIPLIHPAVPYYAIYQITHTLPWYRPQADKPPSSKHSLYNIRYGKQPEGNTHEIPAPAGQKVFLSSRENHQLHRFHDICPVKPILTCINTAPTLQEALPLLHAQYFTNISLLIKQDP